MKTLQRILSVSTALAFLCAPAVRAQDDDMPDGDVDIIEKPKPKKREKKKEEPKKEEPKKEKAKEEPKPKEEPKKREPKEPKGKPAPSDDDDILTGGDTGARIAPKPGDKAAPPPPPPVVEDEDEGEGGRTRLLKAIEEGPPPVVEGDDDVPARAKPLAIDDSPIEDDVPVVGDSADEGGKPPVVAPAEGDEPSDTTVVDTPPTGDERGGLDEDSGDTTWVIVGATAGGLLLLAGAGVGGFFLVDAITPKTGTVTVTPR